MFKKVAVTGGLSCGKSSVCQIFKELGAHTVDADQIVHHLLRSPHTTIGKQVIALLGEDIVKQETLDRAAIAKKVFKDPHLLASLEKILHPAVYEEISKLHRRLEDGSKKQNLFVAEIPLLFETRGEKDFDYTVAVAAPEDESIKRFCKATGLSQEDYQNRMKRQMSQQEKMALADDVIHNNGTKEQLYSAVEALYKKFLNQTN